MKHAESQTYELQTIDDIFKGLHLHALENSRRKPPHSYSIFTSGVYRATAPNVAFPQEKPHIAELDCAE